MGRGVGEGSREWPGGGRRGGGLSGRLLIGNLLGGGSDEMCLLEGNE